MKKFGPIKVRKVNTTENKKIKNAEKCVYDGIEFKSKLEVYCYKILVEEGIPFSYESKKFVLLKGFKLPEDSVLYYRPDNRNKQNKLIVQTRKFTDTTYTPDFVVSTDNFLILIDVKGFRNDVYGYKLKWLLYMLSKKSEGKKYIFYEPHTITQMRQMAKDIKGYLKLDETT